jgi:predicted GTPase
VLVAAATTTRAQALACEGLGAPASVPSGVPVWPIDAIPASLDVDEVTLVACETATDAAVRAWAGERGIPVREDTARRLTPAPGVSVVAVSSPSTASGKTAVVRRIARALRASGVSVAVARHPMANLLLWDRFDASVIRAPDELARPRPLEEREELAPVVGAGVPVATGLDPELVLRAATRDAGDGIVIWDGGGAALPWIEPRLHVVVVDLLRPPEADAYGRIASADVVVLCKADSARAESVRAMEERVRDWNEAATVVLADLAVGVAPTGVLTDRAVVCVEDWSALMIGGLRAGAGAVAARRFRCGVVDPRPFAVGSIREALSTHDHIGPVIPSLGRTQTEIADLAASVRATPGEVVLWASNADPATVIPDEPRPVVRAYGELTEVSGPSLHEVLSPFMPGHGSR